ncbi:hypothetical protein L1887_02182 [Cichorium endivia]|nr:hypothetical protein L1887_02182 [Cichorium endivia]
MCDGCSQINGREPVVGRDGMESGAKEVSANHHHRVGSGASGLDGIGGVEYDGRDRCSGIAGWGWRQAMLGGGVEIFLGLGLTLFMGQITYMAL